MRMTESALAAIGVEWQAARPLGEGLGGGPSGRLGRVTRMTESALPARLKLRDKRQRPRGGVWGGDRCRKAKRGHADSIGGGPFLSFFRFFFSLEKSMLRKLTFSNNFGVFLRFFVSNWAILARFWVLGGSFFCII